jgi:aldehyde:ferredoxin oxidoreductase
MDEEMSYGWMRTDLEIDLSQGKIEKKRDYAKLYEDYLGGKGIGYKLFWDRVPPEVAPFSPNNLLIFGVGPLVGTPAPGANRTTIVTKSPLTNLLTCSVIGGYWGAAFKHAGYDNLIFSGKSQTPIYVWIDDDNVEIRDASHLWGKDARETQRLIREELVKDKPGVRVEVISIGQAGENKVRVASIEESAGNSASRMGLGAVMGDKKIKAIAVHGTKDIKIAKPSEFIDVCDSLLEKSGMMKDSWEEQDGIKWLMNSGAGGNLDEVVSFENPPKEMRDFLGKFRERRLACYNCGIACKTVIPLPDGGYSFVKCHPWIDLAFACKIPDLLFSIKSYNLCEKYGLDSGSLANIIGFAIDLYEKGILTKEDTDGLELKYGDPELVFTLIEKIAKREGIGNVLANGIYEAARSIGKGAEEYAVHDKKIEEVPFPQGNNPYFALATVASDADWHKLVSAVPQSLIFASKELKELYIEMGFFHYPKEFIKNFLKDFDPNQAEFYEMSSRFVAYDSILNTLVDLAGICQFWLPFWFYGPMQLDHVVKLISYATGIDIDETKATKIAERILDINRAYNVILGIRRKDDRVCEKWFRKAPVQSRIPPPYASPDRPGDLLIDTMRQRIQEFPPMPLDRALFDKMVDEYYKMVGWNSEGIPTKEKLEELDLGYVSRELERRGIL